MRFAQPDSIRIRPENRRLTSNDLRDTVELNFGGPKFDVVGFAPDVGEFYIAECKRTTRPVGVGQTFGQILVQTVQNCSV